MHGGMLDVVLVQESVSLHNVSVTAVEGLVPPDAYHPPLDIQVKLQSSDRGERLEPSNVDRRRDWNFKKCNRNQLYELLSEVSWDAVISSKDVRTSTQAFYDIIYSLFDTCTPKKRRNITRRYPTWFTSDIILDIQKKVKLHSKWKKTKCELLYKQFSDCRSSLKSRITNAYNTYVRRIEGNIKKNPKEFWQHISNLKSKGGFEPNITHQGKVHSGVAAAEAFADYFASVFHTEVPKLDLGNIASPSSCNISNYINILNFSESDVINGINKLKLNSFIGPDNIPPWFLKDGKEILVRPLTHIFNLPLKSGVYPPPWKISRVTPIPKSSNRSSVDEYRPIAILSSPAKVFENVLHQGIYKQVNQYLCNEQHGFREKRSVNTNLLTLVNYISTSLDRRRQVDVLYFDFQKAFDRVNNDVLLSKLSAIGVAPGFLRLLADYLRDRQQFVRLGLYESLPYHTRSGVSQGSVVGPLLFILMINDLPDVVVNARCLLYADDLKLFYEIKSELDCQALQSDIDSVYKWSLENKMEFNKSKCYVMSFGRVRRPVNFLYTLNGDTIARTDSMKDLGVIFDRKLTFHDHITSTAKESFRRLGFVLRNCRDFQNPHVIKLVFGALVRSKLESSACVWNPFEKQYALVLEKVQKAFLRYLYKHLYGYYPFLYPTKFLLGCLSFNSLEVRRSRDQMTVIFKIIRGMIDAPDLHNEVCNLFVPDNYCAHRKHRLLAVPTRRTVAHSKSPIPRTLAAINALLDSNTDLDMFVDEWKIILSECLKFCEKNV